MKKIVLIALNILFALIVYAQSDCYTEAVGHIQQMYDKGEIKEAKSFISDMEGVCTGTPTSEFLALKEKVYAYKDTDGDGVPDQADACPHTKGLVENKGCPKLETFTETVNGVSFKMIAIPGGSFDMGSNDGDSDEQTVHRVRVSDFYMCETEVTQELWEAVMGNNPSYFKGTKKPVERVSWEDCQAFIKKLNTLTGKTYRLPSEAEWEYACRAGTTTPFNTGNNLTTSQANYDGNYPYKNNAKGIYRGKTTPVKTFSPNAWGLYDMSGNVYEWCEDKWHNNYQGAPTDGSTWTSGTSSLRVLRGGSWNSYAKGCRSAIRYFNSPYSSYFHYGFRLLISPD